MSFPSFFISSVKIFNFIRGVKAVLILFFIACFLIP